MILIFYFTYLVEMGFHTKTSDYIHYIILYCIVLYNIIFHCLYLYMDASQRPGEGSSPDSPALV